MVRSLQVKIFFQLCSTQFIALDLSGDSFRKFCNKLNLAGIFIRSGRLFHIILDVPDKGFRWVVSLVQHNECLDYHTPDTIR